jgi:hypothetical protein
MSALSLILENAVDRLSPPFRSVFILRAIEQMSIAETADFLGIPGDTVKTRFHRANKLLRRALSAEFGSILEGAFPFLGARCDRLVTRVLERLELPADIACAAPSCDRPAAPQCPPSPSARMEKPMRTTIADLGSLRDLSTGLNQRRHVPDNRPSLRGGATLLPPPPYRRG